MPCQLSDFIGDFSKLGTVQQVQKDFMPDPSLAHIRQAVTEFIAIPLGSSTVREYFANGDLPVNKSFLFFGPQGTGKTMIVRALQTQCNAIVFDLTPSNILEKYTDRTACKKLFRQVYTVAHEYEPAIILMDEIDLVFPKKRTSKEAKAAARYCLFG